ncbi:MAG: hypothetical protein M3X11_15330, partial [Acidobacteriota bacterium]|nr:hypothetical protein [Acidobacteriota bacterium]
MNLKAFLKSLFAALLCLFAFLAFAFLATSPARGQEDPNAQYITILSGKLLGQGAAGETRDVEVPVEVGVLRLFLNLRWSGDIKMEVISPIGRPIALSEANISVTDTDGRRTVSIWDPRPGLWKLRLNGTGDFTASAIAQGEVYVCCVQFFARNLIHQLDKFQPVRGSRHQAQVYASGFNIEAIELQLISEQGELIAPLKVRQSDYSNPYNFTLLMETPDRPFRIRARGRDTN